MPSSLPSSSSMIARRLRDRGDDTAPAAGRRREGDPADGPPTPSPAGWSEASASVSATAAPAATRRRCLSTGAVDTATVCSSRGDAREATPANPSGGGQRVGRLPRTTCDAQSPRRLAPYVDGRSYAEVGAARNGRPRALARARASQRAGGCDAPSARLLLAERFETPFAMRWRAQTSTRARQAHRGVCGSRLSGR